MRRLDVRGMLAELTREEFDRWMVAFHELHLEGGFVAGQLASAIHNELGPVHMYLGLDWEPTEPEDHLPRVTWGKGAAHEAGRDDDEVDRLIDQAARMWGEGSDA